MIVKRRRWGARFARRSWRNRTEREQFYRVGPECNARHGQRTILPWVQNATGGMDGEQFYRGSRMQHEADGTGQTENRTEREQYYRGSRTETDREQYYRGSRRNPVTAATAQNREVKTVGRPGRKRGRVIVSYCGLRSSWVSVENRVCAAGLKRTSAWPKQEIFLGTPLFTRLQFAYHYQWPAPSVLLI